MQRNPTSHKGENGKVAIIGGSRQIHGAPLLSSLAAEASGVDLVFVCLPRCHEEVAKQTALNFQVHPFQGNELATKDIPSIFELLATIDCAVIGPGIGRTPVIIDALDALIEGAPCPLVLDATALHEKTRKLVHGKDVVLTPHLGELERMQIDPDTIVSIAQEMKSTIVLKGMVDHISGKDGMIHKIKGGNAGLTVGGTGDTLAGLIAGLWAQKIEAIEACSMACTIIKRAGTVLFHEKGYAYRAIDVINQIPHLLHTYDQ